MVRWGSVGFAISLLLAGCGQAEDDSSGAPGAAGVGDRASLGGAASNGSSGASSSAGDACLGKVCNSPPQASCTAASTLTTYDSLGTCSDGACSYAMHSTACRSGCSVNHCLVVDMTVDVCHVTCPEPAPTCKDASTLTRRTFSGRCIAPGTCDYISADTPCPYGCENGACNPDPCLGVDCGQDYYVCSGQRECVECGTDDACGPKCSACGGATPKCKKDDTTSQCVECLTDADCGANGHCASASNACGAL